MFGHPIHHVYIADGFIDDVEDLIQKCIQKQNILDFQSFCIVWKEMNIGCMYKGRSSGAEVAELSEEVLQIAKHYMLANTSNYEKSVAGLFLVYALLNLQPYRGFATLRLVPEDVPAITRLESVARRDKRHDVLYILASVLIKGSQYHAADRERGMEAPIKKYLDGFRTIDSIHGDRPRGVFYKQNEELDVLRDLADISTYYSRAKRMIGEPGQLDRNLQYIKEDLPLELNRSLRRIINGIYEEDTDSDNGVVGTSDNSSPLKDHASTVEAIKARAMKEAVNPMKHLIGVADRKQEAKLKQPLSNRGKLKISPKRSQNSTSKRKSSPKGNKGKKSKANPEASTENKSNEDDQDFEKGILQEEKETLSDDEEEVQAPNNTMNLEIGYLPSLIRTDDAGQIVQIELIDDGMPQEGTKVDVIQLPDLDSTETQPIGSERSESNQSLVEVKEMSIVGEIDLTVDDNAKANQLFKRRMNRKKRHLKSKFKRLGILPVANFHDPA